MNTRVKRLLQRPSVRTMTVVIDFRSIQVEERSISSVARWKKNGRYIGYRENIRERVNYESVISVEKALRSISGHVMVDRDKS